jgi:UDP-glucose 4-epimerase
MRVLVPGGAGYIGSFTVQALRRAGHEVVVFDNLAYGHRQAIDVELIVGDLADGEAVRAALARGFDAIVHFAAFIEAGDSMNEAGRFFSNNTANAINLLTAAAEHGIEMFIFSSTAALYANGVSTPIAETAPLAPENVYAASKLLVEQALPWYARVHGLRSVALRYFNAAGAALDGSMGQDHEPASHIITRAIKAALGQDDRFILFGDDYPTADGTCIRDYIHVLDLASAHTVALEYLAHGGSNEIFNVGTGVGHTNREVIAAVKRASGVDFPVEVGARRPGDPIELVADSSRLQQTVGWSPQYSDLDTIVGSAWRWQSTHPHGYAAPAVAAL